MTSTNLPDKAYQLAVEYKLGEPIRMYLTNKRSQLKLSVWIIAILYFIIILVLLTRDPLRFNDETIFSYSLVIAMMFFVALLVFTPLLLMRKTTIYICSSGFIIYHKSTYRVVYWEEIEWVMSSNERCIVYLANKERVILAQSIDHIEMLAQEIELKARLVKRPEGRETLEVRFEHLLSSQKAKEQEEYALLLQGKPSSIENETSEEAFRFQAEYRLGKVVATHHAGFKGILRWKAVGLSIYYTLLFALALLFIALTLLLIRDVFRLSFIPRGNFAVSNIAPYYTVWLLLSSLFMPHFSARITRLHLYTEGFIYIDGSSFEVVRWEQIEKVIYHKTRPILSPSFCHIYLANGDTLMINGYIHGRSAVKQVFDTHVLNKVQAG